MGLRHTKVQSFAGIVAASFSPLVDKGADQGFSLIDVAFVFASAPVASENIVITTTRTDSNTGTTKVVTEATYDPSTSSDTGYVFRFDKRFPVGTTVNVAWANSDPVATDAVFNIELDDKVG